MFVNLRRRPRKTPPRAGLVDMRTDARLTLRLSVIIMLPLIALSDFTRSRLRSRPHQ